MFLRSRIVIQDLREYPSRKCHSDGLFREGSRQGLGSALLLPPPFFAMRRDTSLARGLNSTACSSYCIEPGCRSARMRSLGYPRKAAPQDRLWTSQGCSSLMDWETCTSE